MKEKKADKIEKKKEVIETLTSDQRLAAYQYALDNLANIPYWGVCAFLKQFNKKNKLPQLFIDQKSLTTLFPEFAKQKPAREEYGNYWWPPYSLEPRKEALKKAIKLVN